jgi:hypothetical protein
MHTSCEMMILEQANILYISFESVNHLQNSEI